MINQKIANIYVPSVSYLNDLYFTLSESKMLIRNWVFIDAKPNTPNKDRLLDLHEKRYPYVRDQLLAISLNWDEAERLWIHSLCHAMEDTLFEEHKYIMGKLKDFDSYNKPAIMFEVSSMVEEESDDIMLLTNRLLSYLNKLIEIQEKRVNEAQINMEKSYDRFWILLLGLGIFLVTGAIITALLTTRSILGPLLTLKNASAELEKGNLNVKVDIHSGDEIQLLAETFNQMIVSLKSSRKILTDTNEELKSEREKLEETNLALQKSEQVLTELNASKDKLFALLAHDLKNPFTALLSITESLSESFYNINEEDKKFFIGKVNRSATQIYRILENLLEWARTQTGSKSLKAERLNLSELVEQNLAVSKITAEKKAVRLLSDVQEDLELWADKNMMNSILRNLLNNAIKFNQTEGSVKVLARKIKYDDGGKEYIRIEVSDTGIGISEEDLDKIFRIDVSHKSIGKSKEKGTGLGLILCKEFVEMHTGSIQIESEMEKGTTFIIELPENKPVISNSFAETSE